MARLTQKRMQEALDFMTEIGRNTGAIGYLDGAIIQRMECGSYFLRAGCGLPLFPPVSMAQDGATLREINGFIIGVASADDNHAFERAEA
jgi:hypothetical protein